MNLSDAETLMGSHFFALLKCKSPTYSHDDRIIQLENEPPAYSNALIDRCRSSRSYLAERTNWISADDFSESIDRPLEIGLEHCLRVCDGCHLLFSEDSIGIWHPLRWSNFVCDAEWQHPMLIACRGYSAYFFATDVIITRDGSPIVRAFQDRAIFDDAVAAGVGNEGEVSDIKDLYEIIDEHGTWDSHGFWRLPVSNATRSEH